MNLHRFTLSQLMRLITVFCVVMGSYSLGFHFGEKAGYHQARNQFDNLVYFHIEIGQDWELFGRILSDYPDYQIVSSKPSPREAYWEPCNKRRWSSICEK